LIFSSLGHWHADFPPTLLFFFQSRDYPSALGLSVFLFFTSQTYWIVRSLQRFRRSGWLYIRGYSSVTKYCCCFRLFVRGASKRWTKPS